jgi:hypothetical protein
LATALLISGDGVPSAGADVAAVAKPACTPREGATLDVVAEAFDVGVATEGAVDVPDGLESVGVAVEVRTTGGKTAGGSTGLNGS